LIRYLSTIANNYRTVIISFKASLFETFQSFLYYYCCCCWQCLFSWSFFVVFVWFCGRIANNSGKKGSDADSECEDNYNDTSYLPDRKCQYCCFIYSVIGYLLAVQHSCNTRDPVVYML